MRDHAHSSSLILVVDAPRLLLPHPPPLLVVQELDETDEAVLSSLETICELCGA